ncbi:hypothetical protein [Thiofilum flexile]|uniref:hypothetical protein n=1 Tax=Thiofilum flexile TaxID=125627 RepID=UPI00035F3AA9|nr:hypothetical protein [Thiofilum flexile]
MFSLFVLIILLLLLALTPSLVIFALPHRIYRTVVGKRLPIITLTLINLILVFIVMLIVNVVYPLHGSFMDLIGFIMVVSIPTALVMRGFIGAWLQKQEQKTLTDAKNEKSPD